MKQESLKLNIVFNIMSQIVLYITPLIIAPYISRTLGAKGVGEYSYAASIIYYFNIFIIFGFSSYGTKQIARYRDKFNERNQIFWGILYSRFIMFALMCVLYMIAIYGGVFKSTSENSLLIALIPLLIGSTLDLSFFFQGIEKFRVISIIQVFVNVLYMCLIFIFVKSYNDLLIYTILKSSIGIVSAIIQFFIIIKYISKPLIKKLNFKKIYIESFSFFLPTIIMSINPILDQTMLGALNDIREVAYYEQMYKIITLVNMLVGAISPVMLSRISFLYANGKIKECQNKIAEAIHLGYFIIFPAMIGLICITKYFVPVYFGNDFIPAINVMYVLCISVLFSPISSIIINSYYYPTHKVKLVTILMTLSISINLIANVFAIKYLGAVGAALTTTTLSIMAHILYVVFSWKDIDYKKIYKSTLKIVFSTSFMFGILIVINKFFMVSFNNKDFLIIVIDLVMGPLLYISGLVIIKEKIIIDFISKVKKRELKKRS